MKDQNDLQNNLRFLSRIELHWALWRVRAHWLGIWIGSLRPLQLLIPASLLQMAVFGLSFVFYPEVFLPLSALGNLIIAGLAMLPGLLRPERVQMHWVK